MNSMPAPTQRAGGVLLHLTSLPGDGPCGGLGEPAVAFLDWLASAKCTIWQMLPIHPPGEHLSPYDSPTSSALDTRLINPAALVSDGILGRRNIAAPMRGGDAIDPAAIEDWLRPQILRAAAAVRRDAPDAIADFEAANPWVRDWARFEALRRAHKTTGWWGFPGPFAARRETIMHALDRAHETAIELEIAAQFIVDMQWQALRAAATERGIQIVGDVPIFVAQDGLDTWLNRDHFRLLENGRPDPITGAPPDAFSERGQVWNNPHYAWPVHAQDNFKWWTERLSLAMRRFDCVRIDHFRGLAAAWAIPASANGDARQGAWESAPGDAWLNAVTKALPKLHAIAEDLGHITPDVEALRARAGWPGMRVLQFAFDGSANNPHLPPYKETASVVYTGTHDNDTTIGWYEALSPAIRDRFDRLTQSTTPCTDPSGALMRLAWASSAEWAIAPLQDVLRLGGFARMNTPGQENGNWRWRARRLPATAAAELAEINQSSGRFEGRRL